MFKRLRKLQILQKITITKNKKHKTLQVVDIKYMTTYHDHLALDNKLTIRSKTPAILDTRKAFDDFKNKQKNV